MPASSLIRSEDWRAILQMVGECRELGDDPNTWRRHGIERMSRLVDADLGTGGEMAGCLALCPKNLGVADWGWENGFDRAVFVEQLAAHQVNPAAYSPAMITYFEKLVKDDGICLSRKDIITDQDWAGSFDYQVIHRSFGVDHILWCFRSIPSLTQDEFSGVVLNRAQGRRDFNARDRLIVREANAALANLVGGPLARFADPSPMQLTPRSRDVLLCLLEGDGDKQIAARLGLSKYTVNQYIKIIFLHFGAKSRTELLARWVRRGYGKHFPWRH